MCLHSLCACLNLLLDLVACSATQQTIIKLQYRYLSTDRHAIRDFLNIYIRFDRCVKGPARIFMQTEPLDRRMFRDSKVIREWIRQLKIEFQWFFISENRRFGMISGINLPLLLYYYSSKNNVRCFFKFMLQKFC